MWEKTTTFHNEFIDTRQLCKGHFFAFFRNTQRVHNWTNEKYFDNHFKLVQFVMLRYMGTLIRYSIVTKYMHKMFDAFVFPHLNC